MKKYVFNILAFSTLLFLVSSPLHVFRVARVSPEVPLYFFYISWPLLAIAIVPLALIGFRHAPVKWYFPIFVICLYSPVLSLYNLHDTVGFMGNVMRLVVCLSFIIVGVNYFRFVSSYYIDNTVFIAKASFVSGGLALVMMYVLYFVFNASVYFGLQVTILFIPLAYYLVTRRFSLSLLVLVLIVLAGKRGTILAGLMIYIFYMFFLQERNRRFVGTVKWIFLCFLIVGFIYIFDLMPSFIQNRLDMIIISGQEIGDTAYGSRFSEMEFILSYFKQNPMFLIFGTGLGSVVDKGDGVFVSTVHFSPLAILYRFGVVGVVLVYGFFTVLICRYLSRRKRMSRDTRALSDTWILTLIGELMFSFTAFTILQSIVLWLSVAIILSSLLVQKNLERFQI
ncbi:O-antigen ligase family protein [Pseudidiomarina sp. CB1]|uniref:O-antigen ligase family protein n=1 Tax=Pseudidiomarina sp. CB1 TaxID=2972484 RepID=UPI002162072B|nr:O-antigen ligase family protein [Pseudidiomarina sp. CB1]